MSNAGLPEKPPKVEAASYDDIPIAQRETVEPLPPPKSFKPQFLWILAGIGAIALATGGWFFYQSRISISSPSPSPAAASPSPTPDTLLGHFPYSEAPQSELEAITPDGAMKLRTSAATAYQEMVAAAAAEGVTLVPISAFRSTNEQQQVFFDVKAERNQSAEQRADVSAPPGYSEHHTGYAIDLGDGTVPATNLSPDFDQTPAFQWLQANAARFNFEMSFPQGNKQGVTYEPWHWRFVGDKQSLEMFYKAREQAGNSQ